MPSARAWSCGAGVLLWVSAAPVLGGIRGRQGSFEVPLVTLQDSRTVDLFYGYNTTQASSSATGLEIVGTSLLFLHEDAANALSLVLIQGAFSNGLGGSAVVQVAGLPAGATYAVRDDPVDTYSPDPPVAGQTTASLIWNACCTDGFAITGLGQAPFCVSVTQTSVTGITAWQLLSGPVPPVTRANLPNLVDTVYLCKDCQTLACLPEVTLDTCDPLGGEAIVTASGASRCGGALIANDYTVAGPDASGWYSVGTTLVTFTLTDAAGFESTCQTQVVVRLVPDATPPDQGNRLIAVERAADVVLGWPAWNATLWRMYRDPRKEQLGLATLGPLLSVSGGYVDPGRVAPVPGVPVDYYRVKGASPCTYTPGP